MKKQTNGKKKTPALSVSRKFYVETMTRVRDAMSAVNAGCQETYEMEVYISDYLRSGLQPKRELENRQLLVMMLLKPEIDKAIARSAKARSRTKKERETPSRPLAPEAADLSAIAAEATDNASADESPEAAPVRLNRRQRRLQEQTARRIARKIVRRDSARMQGADR